MSYFAINRTNDGFPAILRFHNNINCCANWSRSSFTSRPLELAIEPGDDSQHAFPSLSLPKMLGWGKTAVKSVMLCEGCIHEIHQRAGDSLSVPAEYLLKIMSYFSIN